MMKKLALVGFLIPAALSAENLNVTLAATPAGKVTIGSPVSLTATMTIGGRPALGPLELQNIHYTFSAQRSWPCQDAATIADDVTTPTVTWTPLKTGFYEISVRAVDKTPALPPIDPRRREPSATASLSHAGQYELFSGVDQVRQSDCMWEQSVLKTTFYTVKP
jgi:hypothetical protein